jgi:hypothetical protein
MSTNKTLALVGLGAVGVFLLSRMAQARALVPAGPTLLPAEQSTLDKLLGGTKTALSIVGTASGVFSGLGIGGGGAAAVAAPVSTVTIGGVIATTAALPAATVGIDASTLAALPGATAIESAPALEAAASSSLSGSEAGAIIGSSAGDVITAIALPLALAGFGYALGWWGDTPPAGSYADRNGPHGPDGNGIRWFYPGDPDFNPPPFAGYGQGVPIGGIVFNTEADAEAAGFGPEQY